VEHHFINERAMGDTGIAKSVVEEKTMSAYMLKLAEGDMKTYW
jgi:hypothetical protein